MIRLPGSIRRALVVAPHPDDETIGAWGLMTWLHRRGARIRVVIVSDGGASHPGSVSWPRARLVAERRRETRRAMRMLGLPPSRIRFLGLPDGELDQAALRRPLARAIGSIPALDLIVGPVGDDAHADHRAVACVLRTHRRCMQLGYRVWPVNSGRSGPLQVPLDAGTRIAKRRAVLSYRTQAGGIRDSVTGMTITRRHLAAFVRPVEAFQVLA